jgi:class 3 adenylate cyclase/tetratricopeptide (TPR) repeat protein
VCSSCGQENPEGFRLCGMCGAPLGGDEPSQQREERKVVSILFVDLVGFTARSEEADPEDVRGRLAPYHSRVKSEIERFGGTVEKFVGDAVMAVFGAPTAHEDDAERAVRAGLRILEAIAELNDGSPGLDLSVRAAVNTGDAVVNVTARPERGEAFVAGDVVNTASRLQGAAPIGGLAVGEATFRATRNQIVYTELEPVSLKGKAEPVRLWLATEARSRFGIDVEQGRAAPFVGREDELSLLQQTFRRTVRDSSVQLVTLVGEPGVGKSRLLGELFRYVDDQPEFVYWRQGRSLPYGEAITFWALGEIVKGHVGILESDDPDEASAKVTVAVDALVDDAVEREWLRAALAALLGTRSTAAMPDREEALAAWQRFLELIAAQNPLVVVFEDLHWADPPLLEFIERLVDWSADAPLLVVCTARPELYERNSGWGGGKRNSTTISLAPLSDTETARLISALLEQSILPAETQRALLERAGGNPLYAEEFVRMLTDRQLLVDGNVSSLSRDLTLPDTVQALIAARLDTLGADRKVILHDAAVLGKVFWVGAVAAMGKRARAEVEEALRELARKELVRRARRSSVENDLEFSFWHALVRDVAYSQIPRAIRARKHMAAAEWILGMAGERVDDHAELLAHPYGEALALARAAGDGELAGAVTEPARKFLELAGDRAFKLIGIEAGTYFRRALELAEEPRERGRLLLKCGRVAGSRDESRHHYEEAIGLLREHGTGPELAEAFQTLGLLHRNRGDTARASAIFREAVEAAGREGPNKQLADIYADLSFEALMRGDDRDALTWAERSYAMAEEIGDDQTRFLALEMRALTRIELGDLRGLDDLRTARDGLLELGQGAMAASTWGNLGEVVWLETGPAAGLDEKRQAAELALERGQPGGARWMNAEMLWIHYDAGAWNELVELADRVVAEERAIGTGQVTVVALSHKALVLAQRGAIVEATAIRDDTLPLAREIADKQVLVPALAGSAVIDICSDRSADAVAQIEEIEELTRGHAHSRARELTEALRVCRRAGTVGLAEALLEGLDPALTRHRHSVCAARATLTEMRGEADAALAQYEEAAARWAEYGFPLEQGHALLGAARCLVELQRREDAAARAATARELFAGLAARPLVAEADGAVPGAQALSA